MRRWLCWGVGLAMVLAAGAEVNQDWLGKVPAKERVRANPYAGKAAAIAGGQHLFEEHCAECHGNDLEGTAGKPSLRTTVVEQATDGELFWLLKNGDTRYGMPSWSTLPEPERWEIVAFLKQVLAGRADALRGAGRTGGRASR